MLAGQQELGDGVFAVELELVQVDPACDDAAGGQGPVDPAAPSCASSALTSPPIEVPNASTWLGLPGSTVCFTAWSVPN